MNTTLYKTHTRKLLTLFFATLLFAGAVLPVFAAPTWEVAEDPLDAFGGSGPTINTGGTGGSGNDTLSPDVLENLGGSTETGGSVGGTNSSAVGGSGDDALDPTEANVPSKLEGLIYNLAVGIGGLFLYVGGNLLDTAVDYLVIGMGERMAGGVGYAVDTIWIVVRDAFNVLFIFGLIYIGFRVILLSDDSNTKKTLGLLIVAALMINFSLFITKAIVDFANVTTYQIYQAATEAQRDLPNNGQGSLQITTVGDGGGPQEPYRTTGISSAFMNSFRISSYAEADVLKSTDTSNLLVGKLAFYGILMMFIMLIAAFVFAAGAFLMISRFVGLVVFMIFSPAMFIGLVMPYFKSYQDLWWNKFLQYAFVGPAYIFMLYITLFVIRGIENSGSFASALGSSYSQYGFMVFLNFFVIAGFLIGALYVAQQMGVYGAGASMGMLKSTGNYVRRGAQGVAGRAVIGTPLRKLDNKLEKSGFRRSGMLRSVTSYGAGAKFGSKYSAKDMHSDKQDTKRRTARANQAAQITGAIRVGSQPNADDKAKIAMERAVSGADTEQLVSMLKEHSPDSPEYKGIIKNMSAGQFDAVMKAKDEDFDVAAKNKAKMARSDATTAQVHEMGRADVSTYGPLPEQESLKAGMKKANINQLKMLGAEAVENNAGNIKPATIDEIKKGTEFTATEKNRIVEAHEQQLWKQFDTQPASVFEGRKDADVARLPKKIFKDPRSIKFLTPAILGELKKVLDTNERKELRGKIEGQPDSEVNENVKKARKWLADNPRGLEF